MDNKSGNKRRGHMKFILDKHVKGREAENLAQIYFLKNAVRDLFHELQKEKRKNL